MTGHRVDRRRVVETLLEELRGLPDADVGDPVELGREMRLRHRARTHCLHHHVPHRLVRFIGPAMPRNQVEPEVDGRGRAGAGDKVALVDEEMIDHRG